MSIDYSAIPGGNILHVLAADPAYPEDIRAVPVLAPLNADGQTASLIPQSTLSAVTVSNFPSVQVVADASAEASATAIATAVASIQVNSNNFAALISPGQLPGISITFSGTGDGSQWGFDFEINGGESGYEAVEITFPVGNTPSQCAILCAQQMLAQLATNYPTAVPYFSITSSGAVTSIVPSSNGYFFRDFTIVAGVSSPTLTLTKGQISGIPGALQTAIHSSVPLTVGGQTAKFSASPTVSTSAYAPNASVGGLLTYQSVFRVSSGELHAMSVVSPTTIQPGALVGFKALVFDTLPITTFTDGVVPTLLAGDASSLLAVVELTRPVTVGGMTLWRADHLDIPVVSASNNLYVVLLAVGTPILTSLNVKIYIESN